MKTIIFLTGLSLNVLITEPRRGPRKVDVVRLGESLCTRLKVPMGSSDDLINDLIDYYAYVENCQKRVSCYKERTVIKTILENNGPPHIKVSVTNKFLKENYNISDVEVDEIQDILVDTKLLWRNMRNMTL